MTINFNLKGAERKTLVKAISGILDAGAVYLKTPTYAYQVGEYHIDKEGTLTGPCNSELLNAIQTAGFTPQSIANYKPTFEDEPTETETEPTFEELDMTMEEELGLGRQRREDPQGENGMSEDDVPEDFTYQAELSDPDYPDRMEIFSATDDEDAIRQAYAFTNTEVVLLELFQMDEDYNRLRSIDLPPNPYRLTISLPTDGFTPEKIDLLGKLVASKETLLKAALGADSLPIQLKDGALHFPWFRSQNDLPLSGEETEAYATFISLLCTTAKEKKRVNGKDKQIETSQKFAMRVFLLSLGMIGAEYKMARKILLHNLSGSAAWPNGAPPKTETAEAVLEGGNA